MLGLSAGACTETEVIFRCKSADGRHVATFYREFGGGAAGFQYEFVSVEEVGGRTRDVLTLKGGYDARLHWKQPGLLEIGYPNTARVDQSRNSFGRRMEGRVELVPLPSRDGSFTEAQSGCIVSGSS
jgi:hypothetical protein